MSGAEDGSARPAAPQHRLSDLGVRAASALVMVTAAIGSALAGGDLFGIVWLGASLAVLWEWQTLVAGAALRARIWSGALVLVAVAVLLRADHLLAACALLVVAAPALAFLAAGGRPLWAAGGLLFAGTLLVATLALRFSPSDGARSILWLFATVWSTDTFAYFGGRLIGGPKLAPRISPSKTWSGTMTGLLAGTLVGSAAALHGLPAPRAVLPVVLLTLTAAAVSQVGDAFESAIKRRFGVKDSSRLIPGHGGVMDRIDGFVAAAALAFCVGLGRDAHSLASGLFHSA